MPKSQGFRHRARDSGILHAPRRVQLRDWMSDAVAVVSVKAEGSWNKQTDSAHHQP